MGRILKKVKNNINLNHSWFLNKNKTHWWNGGNPIFIIKKIKMKIKFFFIKKNLNTIIKVIISWTKKNFTRESLICFSDLRKKIKIINKKNQNQKKQNLTKPKKLNIKIENIWIIGLFIVNTSNF